MPALNDCVKCGKRHYAGSKSAQKCRQNAINPQMPKLVAPSKPTPTKPVPANESATEQPWSLRSVEEYNLKALVASKAVKRMEFIRKDECSHYVQEIACLAISLAHAHEEVGESILALEEKGELDGKKLELMTSSNPNFRELMTLCFELDEQAQKSEDEALEFFYENLSKTLRSMDNARHELRSIAKKLDGGKHHWENPTRDHLEQITNASRALWH